MSNDFGHLRRLCVIDGCDREAAPRSNLCWGHMKRVTRGKQLSAPLRPWRNGPYDRLAEAFIALQDSETDEDYQRNKTRVQTMLSRYVDFIVEQRKKVLDILTMSNTPLTTLSTDTKSSANLVNAETAMECSKHGGLRNPPGGRPKGTRNVLPKGAVNCLITLRCAQRRLGKESDTEIVEALNHIYDRVNDVLEERVDNAASGNVLKAATMMADALAGKQAEKVEVEAKVTLETLVLESLKQPELPPSTNQSEQG